MLRSRVTGYIAIVLTVLLVIYLLFVVNSPPPGESFVFILDTSEDTVRKLYRDDDGVDPTWEVFGWNYFDNLTQVGQGQTSDEVKGIWTLNTSSTSRNTAESNWIRFRNFQTDPPFPVGFGLRLDMIGIKTKVEIRLMSHGIKAHEDNKSKGQLEVIDLSFSMRSPNVTGFCNQVIHHSSLLETGQVDLIEIRAVSDDPNNDSSTAVLIDKIFVTMGSGGSHRSILYTLLPDNWCDSAQRSSTP